MVLKLKIELSKQTENLFLFIGETHRLSSEGKSFIFCFKSGHKLYLKTCNGLQTNIYACASKKDKLDPMIATLNYSVALQANLHLAIEMNSLVFEVSSPRIDKILSFANSLGVNFEVL
ncbi:MAG: hypothetical protein J6A04_02590 [Clostridia bacterium]|nr:hypothetical protein [Clostridia bacterium]